MKNRRFWSLTLAACITLISACEQQPADVSRIGILLFGDSRQPQVDGFIAGLEQLGYQRGKNIEYFLRNAKNDRKALPKLVNELAAKNLNLLVASGGLEADVMKNTVATKNIPVVVSYVNAIKERKLIADRINPGWSVTGVDNLNAEISGKRVELIHDLLPNAKRILILYYQRIAPSRIGVEYAKRAAQKLNLHIDARAVSSRDDIQKIMSQLKVGDIDVMLTVPTAPIDNALKEHILPVINKLKIPLFTHSRPLAEAGALASYGAHFYDLGVQAARLADKVIRGVAAEKLPFETPKKYTYTINKGVLKNLNLTIPTLAKNQINDFINE